MLELPGHGVEVFVVVEGVVEVVAVVVGVSVEGSRLMQQSVLSETEATEDKSDCVISKQRSSTLRL